MMQGSKKEPDININKSTSNSGISFQALWTSMESNCQESALTKNSSFNIGRSTHHFQGAPKMLDFSLQDQDSSSTQSTGQSYSKSTSLAENDFNTRKDEFSRSGHNDNHHKSDEDKNKTTSSAGVGASSYILPPLHADYSQPFPGTAFCDQHFSRVMPIYDPQALVMGARVPLPLDLSTNEPIYVNAKQYRGILRRRQHRAKLEAQNKLLKNRKPYLHESRHQHAVKRARGSSGRFLNKKELQEARSVSGTNDGHKNSSPYSLHLGRPQEAHNREGISNTSGSEVTNSDDIYHHPPEFNFYDYTSRIDGGNCL